MGRLYRNTISRKTYYINEFGNFYYTGQVLEHYDYKGNFLGYMTINSFCVRYRAVTKEKYITVCISDYGKKFKYHVELDFLNLCKIIDGDIKI